MDPLASITGIFTVSSNDFKCIVEGFKQEYEQGLSTSSAVGLATMIPSFVTKLPTGNETGTYLSLDLGGSNLRVSAVHLIGNGQVQVRDVRRSISNAQRTSSIPDFFDWIADAVAELCSVVAPSLETQDEPMRMGVCWSFPLNQTDIATGTILRMGKGFTLDGIEGQDLASLLHQAFARKDLNIVVTALINDAVGTLVAHAYANPRACAGFIYGTGVNAAYPENIDRITKLQRVNDHLNNQQFMLVNTEIDIFGSDASYLPQNRFDLALDAEHSQPGFQLYEKMMSGAYLGELVRLVAVELITEHGSLFQGNMPKQLADPWSFTTVLMSTIESEVVERENQPIINKWFEFENGYRPSNQDMECFVKICRLVSSRAASLAAAAIASLIEQQQLHVDTNNRPIVIGVNGSTFEKYPTMPRRICEALQEWFDPQIGSRIQLELASDGGSIGGALVAMLYHSYAPALASQHPETAKDTEGEDMDKSSPTCLEPLVHATRRLARPFKKWLQKRHSRKGSNASKQRIEEKTQE